jgi:hypothetical protein
MDRGFSNLINYVLDIFISMVCDLCSSFNAFVILVLYQIFEDGINEPTDHHKSVSKWAMNRTYLVYPINAVLQYHRLGNQERSDPDIPFEKVSLVLKDVSLTLTEVFNFQLFYLFLELPDFGV